MSDDATNPEHYQCADSQYEPIKVIEAWNLNFSLGNVIKYIARAGRKGDRLEDLKKARWYLDREISREEGAVRTVDGVKFTTDLKFGTSAPLQSFRHNPPPGSL